LNNISVGDSGGSVDLGSDVSLLAFFVCNRLYLTNTFVNSL